MSFKFLNYELSDKGVATVTLNRPEIHNAFNDELINELVSCFNGIDQDKKVRLVVLTGAGKSFCAGADLNWMKSMVSYSMEENIKDSKNLALLFSTINNCTRPVIGKINGHALGGGVGLVAVCDYAITTDRAKMGFTEVKLGIMPAVISPYVIKKIGESHARAWFLSGAMFKGDVAMNMNLVHEVCTLDDLEKRTAELIESFLLAAPNAAIKGKELIQNVLTLPSEKIEDYTCNEIAKKRISEEGQDGMTALLEKRNPGWI